MRIQAEVSLYTLRTEHLGPPIDLFLRQLHEHDLALTPGRLSTLVEGASDKVFAALSDAFAAIADEHEAVLVVKASNCCPSDAQRSPTQPEAQNEH